MERFSSLIKIVFFTCFLATQGLSASLASKCTDSSIETPDLFGAKFLDIKANPVYNWTAELVPEGANLGTFYSNLNFCNVTVVYTHPGRNDKITVLVWLPLKGWNGRFQGTGGGGWDTGYPSEGLAPAVADGFSAAETDGGHTEYSGSASSWALNSPGNVDLNALTNFASVALNDMAVIGKQVTASFYGEPAKYSYWSGCSTGGRQGLMLAQRYPHAFDGILALAPAINWAQFIVAEWWGQLQMNLMNYYPGPCEFDYITNAAIKACDGLDGLEDGIISLPGLCDFDATSLVGHSFNCNGTMQKISSEAAEIANAAWTGPRSPNGEFCWYGLNRGTMFYNGSQGTGLLGTECTGNTASTCKPAPFIVPPEWFTYFLAKNPDFDMTKMSYKEYFTMFHKSVQEYQCIIGTADPDLSAFKASGGKMITWHGLSDQLIFPNGTVNYYDRVTGLDPKAADFYRFFEAPGVEHCFGGIGPFPNNTLQAIMNWVENGVAPDTLTAISQTGDGTVRHLCPYPSQQMYLGGDPTDPASFTCT